MLVILVVDPSRLYLELLSSYSAFSDIIFDYVKTGEEALRRFSQQNYDLVIVSSQLNDIRGEELALQIHQQKNQEISVILLTSKEDEIQPNKAKDFLAVFHKQEINELVNFISHYQTQYQRIFGKILYVEDSLSQRTLLTAQMQKWGLNVEAFKNAEDAFEALQKGHYDIVITDINLAGTMSGSHFVNKIRRLDEPLGLIPILAITAYDSNSSRVKLFKLGINDYAIKPVVDEELRARLLGLLANYRALTHSRSLMQVSHLSVITIDESRIIISANKKTCELFDYKEDELIGRNVNLLMPEPYHSEHDQYVKNYIQTGKRNIISELERPLMAVKKNGEQFPIFLTVDEVYKNAKRLFVGLIREIKEA